MNRRHFFFSSAGALAAASTVNSNPNDTVRVACVGVRGQGQSHIRAYSRMPNVQIAALCDVDESVLQKRLGDAERLTGKRPAAFTDLRKLLEDKNIDAISIATPNHSHALQAIWGCQAGKDVYVEKPCAYNIFEAKQLLAASKKYNRMVQHGTNARSSPTMQEAVEKVRGGLLGDIYMSRGLCYKWRDTIGRAPVEPVPAGVHYDLWLGPAPEHAFTRNRFHYNFHWFWDYGNGDIGNQGVHQMDAARWLLGVKYPTKITATGGHFMFDDDQETPNTMVATFEFNENGRKQMLVFEVRHWITNSEADILSIADQMSGPAAGTHATVGNIVYGSKGYLSTANGYETFLGKKQEPGPKSNGEQRGDNWANFIQAVRSRKHTDLNAPLEEAVPSVILIHLANISYRLGRTLYFDAETLSCKNDAEANAMFSRQYRAPFVVPEIAS
ncbi:MAG TPA: Gfo/Idh/MocA family oxidoreductase [Bryobacteraceae bacterium]|jgi:predicted dehydrogenase|nr:Gfo/Idh/MocA family oxidoreductase [Bryobacteraceae bacterium]